MKLTLCWQFIVHVCWDHQEGKAALRAFKTEKQARAWVKETHDYLWDKKKDRFRTVKRTRRGLTIEHSLGFEIADLYRILRGGTFKHVDQYQTFADEDGEAIGWISK